MCLPCKVFFPAAAEGAVCGPDFVRAGAETAGCGIEICLSHFVGNRHTLPFRCFYSCLDRFIFLIAPVNLAGDGIRNVPAVFAVGVAVELVVGIAAGSDGLRFQSGLPEADRHFIRHDPGKVAFHRQLIYDCEAVFTPPLQFQNALVAEGCPICEIYLYGTAVFACYGQYPVVKPGKVGGQSGFRTFGKGLGRAAAGKCHAAICGKCDALLLAPFQEYADMLRQNVFVNHSPCNFAVFFVIFRQICAADQRGRFFSNERISAFPVNTGIFRPFQSALFC